jgi:CheY-like chemotaxis protein
MLFGKRKRIVKRVLIVEDEPLTAFDTETMLGDLGYEVVATLDNFDEAIETIERKRIDLIIADVRLHGRDLGIELAKAARAKGIPTLLATGHQSPDSSCQAIACLKKPYTERQLRLALQCIDRHLAGDSVKPLKGLELYIGNFA